MYDHVITGFKAAVQVLLGSQSRSILKEFVSIEPCTGDIAMIDGISPGTEAADEATVSAQANRKTRKAYEALESPALADLQALLTPHMNVNEVRTLVSPKLVEWGHWFDPSEKEYKLLTDPTSRRMSMGMRKVFKQQDALIIAAIKAASVLRGVDASAAAAVNFPAAQMLDDLVLADLKLPTLAGMIKERFQAQYDESSPIFCMISPKVARIGKENSRDKIHSTDFVDSATYFATGKIPTIDGVAFVTHPAQSDTAYDAWTPDAVSYCPFSELDVNLDPGNIAFRKQGIAYVKEDANAVRRDDNGVVRGTLLAE